MKTIKTQVYVGKDGILKLEVPIDATDVDMEVLLVVQPLRASNDNRDEWLAFIERTAGSLEDDPIKRPPQGSYEVRESLE